MKNELLIKMAALFFFLISPYINGKEYYWEHLGLWNEEKYRKDWEVKNNLYKQQGLKQQLLLSKDTGTIDREEVERNIECLKSKQSG
ncbi:MAG: hypothetical protein KDK45_08505 [Leptospiraceae bacterium]|nr:hypothetical protein [Leptospiraceae bacterium]